MGDLLQKILEERRQDAQVAATHIPLDDLKRAADKRRHHSLIASLQVSGTRIIAEMKQASPSAGRLRASYQPEQLALTYTACGAAGISVLTEPRYFGGNLDHLRNVRAVTDLPILRKDFLSDPYQVVEAAAAGADVILLILAALTEQNVQTLCKTARECGLEVLAEAHTGGELEQALAIPDALVGINSRNLRTLTTNLQTAHRLSAKIPAGRMRIAESGIRSREDILSLEAAGYHGFLIGETLLRAADPGSELRSLQSGS